MASNALVKLERRVRAKAEDLLRLQTQTLNFFKNLSGREDYTPAPPPQQAPVILVPIDVNGFYKVTGPQEITFYATTQVPFQPPGVGWTAVGLTGILGQIQITGYSPDAGSTYLWSFTIQSDTDQMIEAVQNVVGATLYPPGQFKFTSQKTSAPIYGSYKVIDEVINFYFSVPPPRTTGAGWIVENLPLVKVPLKVLSYSAQIDTYSNTYTGQTKNNATFAQNVVHESLAILEPIDGSPPPLTDVTVYVKGEPTIIHEPYYSTTFVPGFFTVSTYDPDALVILNQNIKLGNAAPLRELNTGFVNDVHEPVYIDEKNRGFSQGSVLALNALGPQDEHLLSNDYSKSQFSPLFKESTKFVSYERVIPFPPPSPSYQGSTVQIELRPTELGHLLSNMYLHVKMPALKGYQYAPNIGRSIIKQIDLLVNETIIETLYDDWYIIRDQLFLDADEQLGVASATNMISNVAAPVIATGGNNVYTINSTTIHTFLTNNSFTINTASQVNILVVGGGGAGASGIYRPVLTSNITKVVSVPSTFTVSLSNTVGAYIGANVSITTSDTSFTPVVYVQSFDSSSLTLSTFGGTAWTSNITPPNTNISIFNANGGGGGGVLQKSIFLLPGSYSVKVGAGGTPLGQNGNVSSFGNYSVTGGYGGAYGGAAGTVGTSNLAFQYLSNIVYESGGGAGGGANVTTGTGTSAFTTAGTLGSGGNGYSYSNSITLGTTYFGGGGGGASNTSITGTLVTPGGLGGGGAGSNIVNGVLSTAAVSGGVNTGGGGGGAFGTPGSGGSGVVILTYSSTANIASSTDIITPLEFFFCRRHSANNKARERLRKPYFPLCAMWNQKMYVRFTFQPNVWWCNAPVGSGMDLYSPDTTILPTIITEEILLSDEERMYYMNTPLKYLVPRVQRESTLSFSGNNPTLQLTASFPVQTIAWFFRDKNYESLSDGRYSDSRYSYGYTTQYIKTGINLQFPSGNSNFVDVLSSAKITLNNVDILSTFQGSLYYSFKQPLEHSLSIPSKNIYTYSFGLSPKEYNQGGYLNFSKLNSQTTTLSLLFKSAYTTQVTQQYNLYLFYYGYTLLVFQGGFATTPFQ